MNHVMRKYRRTNALRTVGTFSLLALVLIFLLSSCAGSKHFAKLGAKQEAAGLLTEASNSYYVALQKKRTNLDAQIGMKKTGQLVLNNLLSEFARTRNFGSKRDAVYAFHKARDYREKISNVGIELQMAEFYLTDYEKVKNEYLLELYESGTTLLEEQKFQEAETRFNEIRSLEPNYKDSQELGDIAYLEPLYADAKSNLELSNYRAAYLNFEKVISRKASYRDAKMLRDQALEKGRYTIALLPFNNSTQTTGLELKVSAYTLEALTSIKDPFLRVVDREHMQAILNEQQLQLSGVVDDATAVEVGELVGAQAILTGTVLSYSSQTGNLRSKQREAYESYQVKRTNPDDGKVYYETKYKPTNYTEYYNSSSVSISFQYKMISLKTGEIIKTEIIEKTLDDEILYARYDGRTADLYPAAQVGVNLNRGDRQSMLALFNSRQTLRPTNELSNDVFNSISGQISSEIGSALLKLVP